ncbi:MAG: PQQ-like beta-propeller repeat protein [Pirellulales bacterium]|nr:PQQ-like beta-propeller repeat protein [Pirellulales bacterium]
MRPSLAFLLAATAFTPAFAEEWPQFRGPDGQGHAVQHGLPLEWDETRGIRWKTPVPGLGWSSPVVSSTQVWVTTALDDGRSLRAVCLDRESGKLVHDVEVFQKSDPGPIHSKNSHASPTPILDGDRVYVHYGAHGTACVSTAGEVLWRNDQLKYNHLHGPGGSPVLFEDLLLLSCDGTDVQFVVALDTRTGIIRWKAERQGPMAYSTPLLVMVEGRPQLVSTGGDQAVAYDPRSGSQLWHVRYDGYSLVPRPVSGHGLVFLCTGYDNPTLLAVRLGGRGDVTETHVAWVLRRGAPHNPSPVLVEDELYVVSDQGVLSCLDARTGQQHWQHRLEGSYSASLLAAEGRIYAQNEEGLTTVFAADRRMFRRLAANRVEGRTLASLAAAGRALYLRTDTHVYRIEEP